MMSRKDTRIAGRLAQILDRTLEVYDPSNDDRYRIDDKMRLTALSRAHHISIGEGRSGTQIPQVRLEVLEAVPRGGLVLRGNGGEMLSAMLWRRGMREYKRNRPHSIETGLRMMALSDSETLDSLDPTDHLSNKLAYERWLSAFSGPASKRPFDLLYVEHFLSHGPGNLFYAFTRNFYLFPFCDRTITAAIMSLAPDRRAQLCCTEAIIAARAPELQVMKYTRKSVNMHLSLKREEDPYWFLPSNWRIIGT